MYGARNNQNPDAVSMLLKAGADLEASDKNGTTPLMLAAEYNENPEVITALLKAGADAKMKNGQMTALITCEATRS